MMLVSLRPSHARALSSAAAVVRAQPRAFPLMSPTDSAFMPPPPPPPPRAPPRTPTASFGGDGSGAKATASSAPPTRAPPPPSPKRTPPGLGPMPSPPGTHAHAQAQAAAAAAAAAPETAAKLRARVAYIARRAASRSTDAAALLVGTFARAHLPAMDVAQLRELDALLAEPEGDVYAWALARADPPPRWRDSPLIAKLRAYAASEEKQRELGLKEHE